MIWPTYAAVEEEQQNWGGGPKLTKNGGDIIEINRARSYRHAGELHGCTVHGLCIKLIKGDLVHSCVYLKGTLGSCVKRAVYHQNWMIQIWERWIINGSQQG